MSLTPNERRLLIDIAYRLSYRATKESLETADDYLQQAIGAVEREDDRRPLEDRMPQRDYER